MLKNTKILKICIGHFTATKVGNGFGKRIKLDSGKILILIRDMEIYLSMHDGYNRAGLGELFTPVLSARIIDPYPVGSRRY